jgi:hypothetical protein
MKKCILQPNPRPETRALQGVLYQIPEHERFSKEHKLKKVLASLQTQRATEKSTRGDFERRQDRHGTVLVLSAARCGEGR